MSDEPKKIIVDDDWKAEAQREKERIAQEVESHEPLPEPTIAELVNLLAMQALVGLGMVAGQGGERIPPDPLLARHYIDMLKLVQEKTKGNLSAEETRLVETVVYDLQMRFVQLMQMASAAGIANIPGIGSTSAAAAKVPTAPAGAGPKIVQ